MWNEQKQKAPFCKASRASINSSSLLWSHGSGSRRPGPVDKEPSRYALLDAFVHQIMALHGHGIFALATDQAGRTRTMTNRTGMRDHESCPRGCKRREKKQKTAIRLQVQASAAFILRLLYFQLILCVRFIIS